MEKKNSRHGGERYTAGKKDISTRKEKERARIRAVRPQKVLRRKTGPHRNHGQRSHVGEGQEKGAVYYVKRIMSNPKIRGQGTSLVKDIGTA